MMRILYLHGFASGPSSSKAQYFAERLRAAGAQVDIPALDGGDFEHLTITGQLRVLEQAARGEPVVLMGSSMGGYLAALYASRHPGVEKMVLFAPAFGFARRWPEELGTARVEQWRREGAMEFFHYAENRMRKVGYNLIEDGLQYEDYPDVRQPVLIFHGLHDDVVPVSFSEKFAGGHSNVRLEILDSDHQLLNVLPEMTEAVLRFLNRTG